MFSVMTVVSMPSRTSSHAVSRAPCRNGRVSSANTAIVLALLDRGADHAERRAVAGRRQRAGVAVRQDARAVGHHRRAVTAHRAAARDVLVVDRAAPRARGAIGDLLGRLARLRRRRRTPRFIRSIAQNRFTAVGRVAPSGRRSSGTRPRTVACPSPCCGACRARCPSPRRRRSPARRGSPSSGSPWRPPARCGSGRRLLARQLALVDHHDHVALPLDGRKHDRLF